MFIFTYFYQSLKLQYFKRNHRYLQIIINDTLVNKYWKTLGVRSYAAPPLWSIVNRIEVVGINAITKKNSQ